MTTTRIPLIYSGRVRRALFLAEQKHRGTYRKSNQVPYILHPVTVAQVLAAAGADDDIIIAAYLHDVVEDTSFTLAQVEDEFGGRVASLVADVTKPEFDKSISKSQRSKRVREFFQTAPAQSCSVKGGDLVANVTDLILDQQAKGFGEWENIFGENLETKITH